MLSMTALNNNPATTEPSGEVFDNSKLEEEQSEETKLIVSTTSPSRADIIKQHLRIELPLIGTSTLDMLNGFTSSLMLSKLETANLAIFPLIIDSAAAMAPLEGVGF